MIKIIHAPETKNRRNQPEGKYKISKQGIIDEIRTIMKQTPKTFFRKSLTGKTLNSFFKDHKYEKHTIKCINIIKTYGTIGVPPIFRKRYVKGNASI